MPRLKITIPDGTPEEQIKSLKDLIQICKSFGKLTGEDVKETIKPLEKKIAELSSNKKNH